MLYKTDLDDAGLLVPGTFFSSKYRLDLPEGSDLDAIAESAEVRFTNSGLRWRDARNGAPGVTVFVERLAAFLVFVGLSGLAVGGVGVSAAVSSYLAIKNLSLPHYAAWVRPTISCFKCTLFKSQYCPLSEWL